MADVPSLSHALLPPPNILYGLKVTGTMYSLGRTLVLQGAIKMADIGHLYAGTDVHLKWSERLEEEMWRQVRRAARIVQDGSAEWDVRK